MGINPELDGVAHEVVSRDVFFQVVDKLTADMDESAVDQLCDELEAQFGLGGD